MKTEAVRILERLAIPDTIRRFHATDLSAEEAARALDVPLDRVVKTLVVQGDRTRGMGGLQLDIDPRDLIRAAAAVAADLSEDA